MVLFNSLNFFGISIMRQVGRERNGNFYFLLFSSSFNLWWLEMEPLWHFLIFLKFFAIFLEFSITRRVGTERNDNFYFLSFLAFSNLFWLEMKS